MPKRRKRRQHNAGWFKRGWDSRRHIFTTDECRRGYQAAREGKGKCNDPQVSAWVWRKVRAHYQHVSDSLPARRS